MKEDSQENNSEEQPNVSESFKKEALEWRNDILAVNDAKLLDYIRDCVNIRESMARAEQNLKFNPTEKTPYPPHTLKRKLPPAYEEDGEDMV